MQFKSWAKTSFKFARLLLDPTGGDVVFVVRGTDNAAKRLYAYKSILSGNSEYFSTCTTIIELFLQVSFEARMESSGAAEPNALKGPSGRYVIGLATILIVVRYKSSVGRDLFGSTRG
jgi:hypothetical protein